MSTPTLPRLDPYDKRGSREWMLAHPASRSRDWIKADGPAPVDQPLRLITRRLRFGAGQQYWLDYAGARPNLLVAKATGAIGVSRYLSAPIAATAWKRIGAAEKNAILNVGLDLTLNYEWYEGRCLEGYWAGVQDGQWAAQQAQALGYARGRVIVFSHDTGVRNDPAVAAYLHGADVGMRGLYNIGIYSGFGTIMAMYQRRAADIYWQTLAWSGGQKATTVAAWYQNGNQWFNHGADENVIWNRPLGSWRDPLTPPAPPPKPKPPIPAPTPTPLDQGEDMLIVKNRDATARALMLDGYKSVHLLSEEERLIYQDAGVPIGTASQANYDALRSMVVVPPATP